MGHMGCLMKTFVKHAMGIFNELYHGIRWVPQGSHENPMTLHEIPRDPMGILSDVMASHDISWGLRGCTTDFMGAQAPIVAHETSPWDSMKNTNNVYDPMSGKLWGVTNPACGVDPLNVSQHKNKSFVSQAP